MTMAITTATHCCVTPTETSSRSWQRSPDRHNSAEECQRPCPLRAHLRLRRRAASGDGKRWDAVGSRDQEHTEHEQDGGCSVCRSTTRRNQLLECNERGNDCH